MSVEVLYEKSNLEYANHAYSNWDALGFLSASDKAVNCDIRSINKSIDNIDNSLSHLFFIDTLPSEYLQTEFSQCLRLESKLTSLENQIDKMPDGDKKDILLSMVIQRKEYVELKKEWINDLIVNSQDEDYDTQLKKIRLYFKKIKAEFEHFIKDQKEYQNHLKNEVYWDKLLEVLGDYGRAYEHIHADSVSDIELLKILLKNKSESLTPEFENKLKKLMQEDKAFDSDFINQKIESLKDNPVNLSFVKDKKSLMDDGVEKHILIFQHEGKEVRFSLKRDMAANSFEIFPIDSKESIQDLDSMFLNLYARENLASIGASSDINVGAIKDLSELTKDLTGGNENYNANSDNTEPEVIT